MEVRAVATIHTIEPFPADIDRHLFGQWLTGFVDGEGCFELKVTRRKQSLPRLCASFVICLRADDVAILNQIRAFFGCGGIWYDNGPARKNPLAIYSTSAWTDLATIIVPHFERYPLRAKKARDFPLWREAVLIAQEVAQRRRAKTTAGLWKWLASEVDRFAALKQALTEQRRFVAPTLFGQAAEYARFDWGI